MHASSLHNGVCPHVCASFACGQGARVQVYASWSLPREQGEQAKGTRLPLRQLVAFCRLRAIAPRETRFFNATVAPERYALVDPKGERIIPTGTVTFHVGGHQPTAYSEAMSGGSKCVNASIAV